MGLISDSKKGGNFSSHYTESEVLTSIVRGLATVGCRKEVLVEDVVDNDYLAVGTHPAIISEEQFNAVQEERKRRSNKVVTEDGSRRSTTRYSSKKKPSVG